MSKLLNCPICGNKGVPVRNDAEVCSTKCRVKRWRLNNKKEINNEKSNNKEQ